jgi:hypothetical protein
LSRSGIDHFARHLTDGSVRDRKGVRLPSAANGNDAIGKQAQELERPMRVPQRAGVVEGVGPGVKEFAPGHRVIGGFFEAWLGGEPSETKMRTALGGEINGLPSQYRIWPAAALVRMPEHLTDLEAASLPGIALTAWSAIVKLGGGLAKQY